MSSTGRALINDYLKGNPKRVPELEIDEGEERNIEKFLQMEIPVTKVFINNSKSGANYYTEWKPFLRRFLLENGSKITHLRVQYLGMPTEKIENVFLNRLINLESLKALSWRSSGGQDSASGKAQALFPAALKRLKNLDVALDEGLSTGIPKDMIRLVSLLFGGSPWPHLESLSVPSTHLNQDLVFARKRTRESGFESVANGRPAAVAVFHFFAQLVGALLEKGSSEARNPASSGLRQISFEHCNYLHEPDSPEGEVEGQISIAFVSLSGFLSRCKIRMEMVNAAWYMAARPMDSEGIGSTVASLVNLHPAVVNYINMDNLERLIVFSSKSCVLKLVDQAMNEQLALALALPFELAVRPDWPMLRVLHLTIDSNLLCKAIEAILLPEGVGPVGAIKTIYYPVAPLLHLFRFMFSGSVFENLDELAIDFKYRLVEVSNGTAENIARSCANVTKLKLSNWTGTNKGITHLWRGMTRLEEVVIKACPKLGNVAFVGEDVENPVFRRLESKRKYFVKAHAHANLNIPSQTLFSSIF